MLQLCLAVDRNAAYEMIAEEIFHFFGCCFIFLYAYYCAHNSVRRRQDAAEWHNDGRFCL